MARHPSEAPTREEAMVHIRRFEEAIAAGMKPSEARKFAESDADVGELRHLVELHWPPDQLANMLN